ncbi:MAG: NAD(P)-binding domain-containing protein [Deinococcota bacterium]|nr:NAD(P)-binding domain-containing protein [Deinococcota bacterium]
MERLALIGVSHRRGGAAALEAWQRDLGAHAPSDLLARGFAEAVTLSTCNRFDLVVVLPAGMPVDEARHRLSPAEMDWVRPYAYLGEAALEHIIRVAASLESLNPGEDQIVAQVREAFALAQAVGSTGPVTSFAFSTALRIAKRVRRQVALAPMNTSLFSLARPELERHLPEGRARVAVVGAGEMGALAAKALACRPATELVIVNRRAERAEQLARHLGVKGLALSDFLAAPPELDALICATPVKDLIDERVLARLPELKIAVDLGVPRNVEAEAASARGLLVLDVDSLQDVGQRRRQALTAKLAEAEAIIQHDLEAAMLEWTERQLGPSIKRLRELYLATILATVGDSLAEDEAARLAHKFARVPIKGLRAVAREHGLEAARTFLDETGLWETGLWETGLWTKA